MTRKRLPDRVLVADFTDLALGIVAADEFGPAAPVGGLHEQRPASLAGNPAWRFENAASRRSSTVVKAIPHCGTAGQRRGGLVGRVSWVVTITLAQGLTT